MGGIQDGWVGLRMEGWGGRWVSPGMDGWMVFNTDEVADGWSPGQLEEIENGWHLSWGGAEDGWVWSMIGDRVKIW